MALEEEHLYSFQSALHSVSVVSLGVSFGLCFVICGFRRAIWICLLFGSASALVSPGWCWCLTILLSVSSFLCVCVWGVWGGGGGGGGGGILDLCSLLRCVGGWWCSVLAGWSGIIVGGWGSWGYQHLSPNLQLGPFRHISLFILCCFLSLFPLSFLAFSIVSRMSCFVRWQFLGVADIVIFVSSPLSSIMMVVLCLVCILRFSPPFPITLPVYSLLIDIVVVLSCSRCLVWWWLVGGCLSSGVCAVLWVVCRVHSEHSAFQFLGNYMYFGSWCEVYVVLSVGLWSCTVRLFWWCCWGTPWWSFCYSRWFHGQLLLGAVVSTCMGGCGFQIVGWQFSGFRWCLLQVFCRVCHLFRPLCTQVCSGVSYFQCCWPRPASCRWLHVSLTFCFWCVRSLEVRSSQWVVVFLPFWW